MTSTSRRVEPQLESSASSTPSGPTTTQLVLAGLSSLLLGSLGLWLLAEPERNPLANPDQALLRAVLGPTACTAVLLALAALGLATGGAQAWRGTSRRTTAGLLTVGLVQVLVLGIALQSVTSIALAGYLLALALPLGLIALVVQVVRRYRGLRWVVLAAAAALLAAGVLSDTLRPATLARLAAQIGGGFGRQGLQLLLVVAIAASTAAWAVVVLTVLRSDGRGESMGRWVDRHRRGLTLLAAAGPLPYALARATWLTPWPLYAPDPAAFDPETRLWGLLLGGGAALGCILTIGLIRPWGRVFPRWMPGLAGRPVPPYAAIIPGALVAGVVTASAAPMVRMILAPAEGTLFSTSPVLDQLMLLVVFPFWFWGPALGLAVWGYARSRRH